MAPTSNRSSISFSLSNSNSFSDGLSTSHPVSESAVPELDTDVSTTDDLTSDYLSTRTRSILGPIIDHDDGYGSNHFDNTSIYTPSHFPTFSITYRSRSIDRSREDAETVDSTRSITDLDVDYIIENGRRYCGPYYMPNDDDEQVRLQLLNQVYLKIFDGELTTVPLEGPTHILDIGTAVGEWAIDMAEAYPECEVTGTDISNIFERRVPQNVYWEIDDAEIEWERPSNYYDLVHLREMTGAFADWEAIYRSAFRCLKPGGWIEVLDFDDRNGMRDLFAYFEHESLLFKLAQDLQEASVLSGRPRGIEHLEPRLLVNAGYVDVKLTEYSVPLKTQDGSTGKFWLLACLNGMEPVCMRLLTKFKGWSPDNVRLACEMVGEELITLAQDPQRAKTFVVKLRVLTGRKPGNHVRWSTAPLGELRDTMEFNEGRLQADSESTPDAVSSKGTSTGLRQSTMPAINELTEQSSKVNGDEHIRHSTGHTTEDWLENVDHSSNDIDYDDELADATTDDTMVEEREEENIKATASTDDSVPTTAKGRPSSTSGASLAATRESQSSQSKQLIPEHTASGANGTSRRSRPRQSTL